MFIESFITTAISIVFSTWFAVIMFLVTIGSFAILAEPDRYGRIAKLGFTLSFIYWMSLITYLYLRS